MRRLALPLVGLGVLQCADVLTTYVSLRRGGQELNPLAAHFLSYGFPGLIGAKAGFLALSAAAAVALSRRGKGARACRALLVLCAVFSGVVLINAIQLGGTT